MISKNKIIALILGVSLASSATYESYAYFSGEKSAKNNVGIVELDSKEGAFEVSKIRLREGALVLELSKRIFYTGEDLKIDVEGSEGFLDNTEIKIEGKEIILTKTEGEFVIPEGAENILPSIKLTSNFEDRFYQDLVEITMYLYKDNEGNILWSLTNEYVPPVEEPEVTEPEVVPPVEEVVPEEEKPSTENTEVETVVPEIGNEEEKPQVEGEDEKYPVENVDENKEEIIVKENNSAEVKKEEINNEAKVVKENLNTTEGELIE